MGDPEQKAMELMAQAEKKMKSSGGFFGSLMGCGSVFQPGFRGTQGFRERLPRVPQLASNE